MGYQALYRKWRPQTFTELVGQAPIVTALCNQVKEGRLAHAYLFTGSRGTGKTSAAKILARAVNCQNPKDGNPCNECAVCRGLLNETILDVMEIDAASNNGVDEMRDLREKVQYPPVAGKYKVFIIDEVHMLSPGAFNALLKTLEEPPSHAVFVLATTESQKIPATILSRCMRFDFKLIPQSDLEERLRFVFDKIGKKYDAEAISAIARAGAGSVRDMLSVADTCVSYTSGKLTYADVTAVLGNTDFSAVAALCGAILKGDTGAAFEKTEAFLAAGKSVGMLLKDVMNFLNACAVAKTCRDGKAILAFPDSMYTEVVTIAKETDGHRLLRVMEIFARVETELKYSTSQRILFETAVLKAAMPQEDYDIEALIARISALEKQLAEGVVVQNAGGRVALSEQTTPIATAEQPVQRPTPKPVVVEEKKVEEVPVFEEFDIPPDEDQTGGNAYFDGFAPKMPTVKKAEEKTVAPAPVPVKPVCTVSVGDAKATFGSFLRTIRKIARNGILLTLCMDLDGEYDGDVFVLYTTSDTVYRSLTKPEHYASITQAFAEMGVAADGFAVRIRGKQSDDFQKAVNEIKSTFDGVKVDIK